jgi:hypothetical protein
MLGQQVRIVIQSVKDAEEGKNTLFGPEEAKKVHDLTNEIIRFAVMEHGMQSGRTSVAIAIPFGKEGEFIFFQMSARQLNVLNKITQDAARKFEELT